jgi:hypothetical protein
MEDVTTFRITYDGPALARSEMDVRELAPALLAVGDMLDAATQALCGGRVKPQVNVKGTFKTGSFGIDFNVATDFLSRVRDIFAGDTATALANAAGIIAALGLVCERGHKGLLQAIKWLRGREIKKVSVSDKTAIIFVDEDQLEIELQVLTLLRDVAVRDAAARMLEPLSKDGIDTFAAGSDDRICEKITSEQTPWFTPPTAQDELLLDDTRKMVFSIVSLTFKEDNKWRLFDGAATIHASITDEDFLRRVDNNLVNFAKGDVLICNVRVRQWQTKAGARTEYEVVHVIDHRTVARQINLPGV